MELAQPTDIPIDKDIVHINAKLYDNETNELLHTHKIYTDHITGTLKYKLDDKDVWICPHARWGLSCLMCQLKYDTQLDYPVSQWKSYVEHGFNILENPAIINSACVCKNSPGSWEECSIAEQYLKEVK